MFSTSFPVPVPKPAAASTSTVGVKKEADLDPEVEAPAPIPKAARSRVTRNILPTSSQSTCGGSGNVIIEEVIVKEEDIKEEPQELEGDTVHVHVVHEKTSLPVPLPSRPKDYACRVCGKAFGRSSHKIRHEKSVHKYYEKEKGGRVTEAKGRAETEANVGVSGKNRDTDPKATTDEILIKQEVDAEFRIISVGTGAGAEEAMTMTTVHNTR
jgi:hypothetical protein